MSGLVPIVLFTLTNTMTTQTILQLVRKGLTADQIDDLDRLARRAKRWDESLCNDTYVNEEGKAYRVGPHTGKHVPCHNPEPSIRQAIADLQLPGKLEWQHDPRGATFIYEGVRI